MSYDAERLSQSSPELQAMLCGPVRPGSVVWNTDLDAEKIFVKCKDDTWAYFEEVTLPGLGKLSTPNLIKKLLKKKKARGKVLPDANNTLEFQFNFL